MTACRPDTFRKEGKSVSQAIKDDIYVIKSKAENLLHELESIEVNMTTLDKRCMALAKTNLEQAVMWAVKAIT